MVKTKFKKAVSLVLAAVMSLTAFMGIGAKFSVTVTKSDREEGTPQGDATLAGAVYGIYKGETLVDKYVTDKNGQFNGEYQRCSSGYRSCPACSVFCCRCGSHLRQFYRCKETGTRIKAVYPLCHCQRCDYLRAGAYACPVRHCTRYDFNHYDICGIRYAQPNNLTC